MRELVGGAVVISGGFDSGNVVVVDSSDVSAIRLAIRRDNRSDHYQWFYFRVTGARGVALTLILENARHASYPKAWSGTRAVVSADREVWRRTDTEYVDGELHIRLTPSADSVWVAYFAPYGHDRHLDLIARCQGVAGVRHDVLGATVDGRDLDRLVVGEAGEGRRTIWVIGRQHPGETMASFWMEGFLERLLDPADPLARRVREAAVFHVVPHMNPDGGVRGHLRTNAAGVNLNRAWDAPSVETSPEVFWVRGAMDRSGVDLCLDVHGDEELPYTFIAGPEGIEGYTPRLAGLLSGFKAAYEKANPDFQTVHGYPPDPPGEADLSMCTSQVAQRFDALAMTLEMPFKDNANAPDPEFGWSPARCRRMGASAIDAIAAVLPNLR
jgi:murein tripeptide amidase MpaA